MKDERIQQVLKIEKEAQEIYDSAKRESDQLVSKANQEADTLIERSRTEAQDEAQKLISSTDVDEESARILSASSEKVERIKNIAKGNFDRAVSYVIDRVAGRE